VSYPVEAGAPIGGADFSRYVMLEVHYNNPDKITGTRPCFLALMVLYNFLKKLIG